MSTFLRETQTGCLRSLVIQVIAVLIVVPLGCVLIFLPLTLVTRSDLSIWWLIIPASLFLLILVGGGIGALVLVVRKRIHHTDALFAPLGLEGKPYSMFFRQYRGSLGERQAETYFYRGPTLEVDISTPLQTRLAVTGQHADTLAFARLMNREPLVLTDPALGEFTAFGLDETWSKQLLAQPGVADLLRRMISFEGSFRRRHVILRPGWLRLQLFGSRNLLNFTLDVTPEQVQGWTDDLQTLARIAERLPAPQATAGESSAERMARSIRDRNPYLIPAITVGVILLMSVCAVAIGAAALFLTTL